jgi:cell division protein FtsB
LTNDLAIWTALLGTLFGGVGLRLTERFVDRKKTTLDYEASLRKELREENAELHDENQELKAEAQELRKEVNEWRIKFYTCMDQYHDYDTKWGEHGRPSR